jgi:hypothetical protein
LVSGTTGSPRKTLWERMMPAVGHADPALLEKLEAFRGDLVVEARLLVGAFGGIHLGLGNQRLLEELDLAFPVGLDLVQSHLGDFHGPTGLDVFERRRVGGDLEEGRIRLDGVAHLEQDLGDDPRDGRFDLGLFLGVDGADGQGLLDDVAPGHGNELDFSFFLAAGEQEIAEHQDKERGERAQDPLFHRIPLHVYYIPIDVMGREKVHSWHSWGRATVTH